MANYILVGNPNVGKTTFFNSLTKSNNHVGNWHGVTVDISQKQFLHNGKKHILIDLPGIYSLDGFSAEEHVAINYLTEHKNDIIINIADSNNLRKNLLLTLQLLERGHKVVLAINMTTKMHKTDFSLLSKALNIPVFCVDARSAKQVKNVIKIDENFKWQTSNFGAYFIGQNKQENNIKTRFDFIDNLLKKCRIFLTDNYKLSWIDKILINKYFALPIFLLVMLLVFVITFGSIGNKFSVIIGSAFDWFADLINTMLCSLNISAWAHALVMQGIIGGIGVVISFLPQVVLLYLCMNFLEDIGYLSRVAIMFDYPLKKLGLTGKSLFSLLMGFGCTTSAMLTTRALDNLKLRKRTALILPFASCSAKLPIYALICSAFFTKYKALMVFLMYVLGIVVGIVVSLIASKISGKKDDSFIMELPLLRLPTIKKTFKNLVFNVWDFIKRVGSILMVCSVVFWILSNLNPSFKYVSNVEDSIIYVVANVIYPVFKPLGFSSPLIVVALIMGIVAKEMIVSCLAISNGAVGNLAALATSLTLSTSQIYFTIPSALAFLVFVLIYSPCISTLSVVAKEIGKKFAIFVFVFQFALAYVCAFVVNWVSRLIIGGKVIEGIIILLVLALIIFTVIKCIRKKNICNTCKGKFCGKTCMQKAK